MEITLKVNAAHGRKSPGRIEIRADEEGLTAHAGLAITGELVRKSGLVGMLDGEIAANRQAAPVKQRERGASPGELLACIAEAQLALLEAGEDAGALYGYSFILTDRDEDAVWIEHHHRHRAQIEERIREAKLGAALRNLPSGDINRGG